MEPRTAHPRLHRRAACWSCSACWACASPLPRAIVGAFGLAVLTGWGPGLATAGVVPHASVANYTLSVLPMFILIGYLAYYAGITQAAFEAARRWLGWLPGGLAIATVFAVAGFSAVSGASTAAAAVFAKVAIPEMLQAKLQQAAGGRRVSRPAPRSIR